MSDFTHLDASGQAKMVDVGQKPSTARRAVARCEVLVSPRTMELLRSKALPKGDVLAVARVAGIQGAKKTSELIPLCHPLFVSGVDVDFEIDAEGSRVLIQAEARTTGPTGVEMEALVAAQVAALAIYDMCKAIQKDIRIDNCRLIHKSGGRSGEYNAG
jgi:cyclic pyranopterin phosphate synthase